MGSPSEVLDYVSSLPIGGHAVLFYETEEFASEAFASYVNGGVERQESFHFVSPSREDQAHLLEAGGVDVDGLERDGWLSYASIADFCLEHGRLSWRKASENLQALLKLGRRRGWRGVRVSVLADICLRYASPLELAQFERMWGTSFSIPITLICSYDARRTISQGSESLLVELLKIHGHCIFKGLASGKIGEMEQTRQRHLGSKRRSKSWPSHVCLV